MGVLSKVNGLERNLLIMEFMRQMVDILYKIHQKGLIYNDLRPEHVRMTHNMEGVVVSLTDFVMCE